MFLCQREEIFGNFPELCFFMLIDVISFLFCKSINEESSPFPGIHDDCAVATGFSLSGSRYSLLDYTPSEIGLVRHAKQFLLTPYQKSFASGQTAETMRS